MVSMSPVGEKNSFSGWFPWTSEVVTSSLHFYPLVRMRNQCDAQLATEIQHIVDMWSLKTSPLSGDTMIPHLTNSLTLRVDRQSQALLVRLVQTDRSWPIPLCLLSSVTGEATVRKSMSGSKLDSMLMAPRSLHFPEAHSPGTLLTPWVTSAVPSPSGRTVSFNKAGLEWN